MSRHDYNSWAGYGVRVVRERKRKYRPLEGQEITQPHLAYELLKDKLGESDREMFVIVILNARNHVQGVHTVSVGSLEASIVHPREVFRVVLLMGAASIILAHNHPSGTLSPSRDDVALTTRLKDAGELLGIKVLDHLIIGEGTYCSLKEEGHLQNQRRVLLNPVKEEQRASLEAAASAAILAIYEELGFDPNTEQKARLIATIATRLTNLTVRRVQAPPDAKCHPVGKRYQLVAYLRIDPDAPEPMTYEQAHREKEQQEMMSPENLYQIEEVEKDL